MISCRKCFPIFIRTIETIEQRNELETFYIKFSTGRYAWSQEPTEAMFVNAGLGHLVDGIMYYPSHLRWYSDDYIVHKTGAIEKALNQEPIPFDRVYFFDDNTELMQHLFNKFANEERVTLIHVQ